MNTIEYLRANEYQGNDSFVKQAQYLRENWDWLKYSYAIAIKVKHRMEILGLTQKQLAEELNCSQQHVSVLLNGRVNMTLETLAKLEKALHFDIIGAVLTDFDAEKPAYLNDSYNFDGSTVPKTKHLVEGYKSRKKKGPKRD